MNPLSIIITGVALAAMLGAVGVLLINQVHQQQILMALLDWLVVIARPGKSNQLALPAQADVWMSRIDQPAFFLN